jgi:PAS domain-containing protein
MKISYTTVLKAYTFFAILFFIFGALAIVAGGPALIVGYAWKDPAIQNAMRLFRLVVVFVFGASFVISSFILVISRRRGFVAYKRIIERLSSDRSMNFNLNITFPEEDEFGNLGKWLNKLLAHLRDFDRIKVERLRAAQQEFNVLVEAVEKGLMVVDADGKIKAVNSHFRRLFNTGDKTIVGLPLDSVLHGEKVEETLTEIAENPKNRELEDIMIESSEVTYKTTVRITPVISSDVALMETLFIFDYIQKKALHRER